MQTWPVRGAGYGAFGDKSYNSQAAPVWTRRIQSGEVESP